MATWCQFGVSGEIAWPRSSAVTVLGVPLRLSSVPSPRLFPPTLGPVEARQRRDLGLPCLRPIRDDYFSHRTVIWPASVPSTAWLGLPHPRSNAAWMAPRRTRSSLLLVSASRAHRQRLHPRSGRGTFQGTRRTAGGSMRRRGPFRRPATGVEEGATSINWPHDKPDQVFAPYTSGALIHAMFITRARSSNIG